MLTEMLSDRDGIVTRSLLERGAADSPDKVLVLFEDGSSWTYAQALDVAYRSANVMRERGVGQGDRVAVMLPNGPEFLRAWWGASCLGAVLVPINPVFRGMMLARLLSIAEPAMVVTIPEFEAALSAESCSTETFARPDQLYAGAPDAPVLDRPIEPWDTLALIMTSGTTGLSKLVSVTYLYPYVGALGFVFDEGLTPDDRFMIDLPLFHMGAICYLSGALIMRGSFALRSRPALDNYWEIAKESGVTCCLLMSSVVPLLVSNEPDPVEREHGIRVALMSPIPANAAELRDRFGIESIFTTFGMTEVPSALRGDSTEPCSAERGYCGKAYRGYELRIVDEHDVEVPTGSPGELILRHEIPWVVTSGYHDDPAATAKAWRNGWFHTGDMFRRDEQGNFFFVDRLKDALRRRGENISAVEVEAVVNEFPAVRESACVAAPSDSGIEDDVKVWVVLRDGYDFDPEALLRYCHEQMPHYMVPRYFEPTEELPKTPTLRVQKHVLRGKGSGALTWDRESAGYQVTRRGIEVQPR